MTTEQQAKADQIAFHYGTKKQLEKCKEELGELMIEIDLMLQNDGDVDNLVTELADVQVTIYEVQRLFTIQRCVSNEITRKLDRQLGRIADERKD